MDEANKKYIFMEVEPFILYPLVEKLTVFGQVSSLVMLQNIFTSYRAIDEIYLEENKVKMMGTYDPAQPLSRLIKKLEKGKDFAL